MPIGGPATSQFTTCYNQHQVYSMTIDVKSAQSAHTTGTRSTCTKILYKVRSVTLKILTCMPIIIIFLNPRLLLLLLYYYYYLFNYYYYENEKNSVTLCKNAAGALYLVN